MKKISIIAVIIAASLASIACSGDNGDEPITVNCECPNGTLHVTGEDCCLNNNGEKAEDCECETVAGVRVEGIVVTNRDNVANFTTNTIPMVEEVFSWLEVDELATIKNKVNEIRLLSGNGTVLSSGGVITIRENSDSTDLYNGFYNNFLTKLIQPAQKEQLTSRKLKPA